MERSVASDLNPPSSAPGATFYLEDGSGAANVRDVDLPAAVANLQSRGFQAVHVTGADPNVTGSIMASHVTAGVYGGNLQSEIASNTYPPGAITDCLESFGLTPNNFTPGAGDQAPVTWWVTSGITGAQGTVAEPYNVAFPDGFMLEPHVDGYNLGETYYQGIPYLYWMNLVLGDPLAQPYAVPPTVTITAPPAGGSVSGFANLAAFATTPAPLGIRLMEMFVDDTQVNLSASGSIAGSWDSTTTSDGWHRVEAIAYENTKYFAQGAARRGGAEGAALLRWPHAEQRTARRWHGGDDRRLELRAQRARVLRAQRGHERDAGGREPPAGHVATRRAGGGGCSPPGPARA